MRFASSSMSVLSNLRIWTLTCISICAAGGDGIYDLCQSAKLRPHKLNLDDSLTTLTRGCLRLYSLRLHHHFNGSGTLGRAGLHLHASIGASAWLRRPGPVWDV